MTVPGWGDQCEWVSRQAQVVAPKRYEVAGDTNGNPDEPQARALAVVPFRRISALTIAASSVAITFVLLAGFVAGSPSPATETSITTVAR
jgi:hypothetical protein